MRIWKLQNVRENLSRHLRHAFMALLEVVRLVEKGARVEIE
jgi:hypothetical protein